MFVDLVENIVPEEFHDISVTRFRPSRVPCELGSFVDETKLAQ